VAGVISGLMISLTSSLRFLMRMELDEAVVFVYT
jgi:hypothetical protein